MSHKHSVYDTDPHFSIDPVTRAIKNESGKVIIIQHDHNSERFTFDIPREIDTHDMSLCNRVRIHYINISDSSSKENYKDVYEVEDLQISPSSDDVVIFSWLLSGNCTQYKGSLSFAIRFDCVQDDGSIDYSWGTAVHSGIYIGEDIYNSLAVVQKHADVLEQWYAKIFGVGDTQEARLLAVSTEQQSAIESKGEEQLDLISARGATVLASIPDEYEDLSALANQNERIKAGAIVLNAEGEVIRVDDSDDAYLRGLKVFGKSEQFTTTGKNLVNLPQIINKPASGYNYDLFTNSVGVATSVSQSDLGKLPVLAPGTYYFYVEIETNGSTEIKLQSVADDGTTSQDKLIVNKPGSFTLTEETRITFRAGTSDVAIIRNLQVEIGDQYTGYEPYTGGKASPSPEYPQEVVNVGSDESVTVNVYGSNLLDYETWSKAGATYATATFVDNGVVLTTADDKGDGFTNYVNKYSKVPCVSGVKYILSWEHSGANGMVYIFPNGKVDNMISVWTNEASQLEYIPSDGVEHFTFRVGVSSPGVTAIYKNVRINVLEKQSFEPYKEPRTMGIPSTLPGIPVNSGGNYTDSDGQQYICDEVDFERGVYVQRLYKQRILSEQIGSVDNAYVEFGAYCTVVADKPMAVNANRVIVMCDFASGIAAIERSDVDRADSYRVYSTSANYAVIRYPASVGEITVAKAREDFSGRDIVYLLETPIETPLAEAELNAFKQLRSNKLTTTILNDSGAHMSVSYVADTKTYVDNKIAELVASITNT